nr:HypC/HybG/HupF family hydrogenase formation chaperone [uncultured Methanospirillum sp.]
MCIAVPAEIIEIKEGNVAVVDFGNLKQEIRVDLIDANVGDFVLVHVGFAIQKIDRDEALETRELFKQCYEAIGEEAFPA